MDMVRKCILISFIRRHYFACNFTMTTQMYFWYIYREREEIDGNYKKGLPSPNQLTPGEWLRAWCSCPLLDDTLRPELSF